MPFVFSRLEIPDLILIEPRVHEDARGFFMETYKMPDFAAAGIAESFVQDNHSRSARGVLRGLHYQNPPFAQGKLVRTVSGKIFDVAVDIRKGSPTYARWVGITLSAQDKRMLYIPEGFAHGFLVLSQFAEVVYKTTALYSPQSEAGIAWDDNELMINWPISEPTIADRDRDWPDLKSAAVSFYYDRQAS